MATPTTLPASFVSGAVLTAAQMNDLRGAFRILQTAQTIKTDTFSTTSTSFVDVTGLSVTITPQSTTNKILLIANVSASMGDVASASMFFQFTGGNSGTYVGDAASNRVRMAATVHNNTTYRLQWAISVQNLVYVYLDSPATTSATTYKIQARVSSDTGYVNRSAVDTDTSVFGRAASSITAFEVSA